MNKNIIVAAIIIILSVPGIVNAQDDIWQKVYSDSSGYDKVAVMSEFKGDLYAGVGTDQNQAKILGMVDPSCQNWIDVTPPWVSDTGTYVMSILVFKDNLYVGTDKGQIFRTGDGANWEDVNGDLPAGMGIFDMAEVNGQLYLTNSDVYRLKNDTTPPYVWEYVSEQIKPTYTNKPGVNPPKVESLEVFKDKLYAGVGLDNDNGIEIWRTITITSDGITWEKFFEKKPPSEGLRGLFPGHVHAFKSFKDYLYLGTYHGGDIYITDGITWETIPNVLKSGDTFRLEGYKDNLYLGAWHTDTNPSLYYSEDGTSWIPISGFRDIFSIASYGNNSYIGTNELREDNKGHATIYQHGSNSTCGNWNTEFAEFPGLGGQYSSIAIDSSGDQHMSYYGNRPYNSNSNSNSNSLSYIDRSLRRIGGIGFIGNPPIWSYNWCSHCSAAYPIDNGEYTSIAVDSSNYSHISYYDRTNGDLKYAKWTGSGSAWNIETVDSNGDVGEYTHIVLDKSNYPHISYYDRTNGDLKRAKWNGNTWDIETVDSNGDVGEYTSIVIDSSNYPHISYYNRTNGDLKYAKWNGNTWDIETVDYMRDVGMYSSIALDSSNNPRISYYDGTNGDLKYADKWNGKWFVQIVDSKGDVGEYTSLAVDSQNYPYITYYDRTNGNLKYAVWLGDWYIEIVDSKGNVGEYTSLALDSSDKPHISYYDSSHNSLKYADKKI